MIELRASDIHLEPFDDGLHVRYRIDGVLHPGELVPAQQGAHRWLDGDYAIMNFLPAPNTLRPGDGPPHIRLDRAAEFLIGDRL